MSSEICVLDASALLCMLFDQPGADKVETLLSNAELSSVNYAEVVSQLVEKNEYDGGMRSDLASLGLKVVPFDRETSELAGLLRAATRQYGLSLGYRCCLAPAKLKGAVVLTTDRAWAHVEIGVRVELVR